MVLLLDIWEWVGREWEGRKEGGSGKEGGRDEGREWEGRREG